MKRKSDTTEKSQFLIVTGLSGAGKSTAIKALEDIGFYCVDNLPLTLMKTFAQLCLNSAQPMAKVALGIDIREGDSLKELPHIMEELRRQGIETEILFLHAQEEVLIKRFKETRRPHPLQNESLEGSIAREKEIMEPIKTMARYVIDTSEATPHTLKAQVKDLFGSEKEEMLVYIHSFGFKHGAPPNLDLLLDVRFLPNPHFVNGLRDKTGLNPQIKDYIMSKEETQTFLDHLSRFLSYLLPQYQREGKPFLSMGIGCTGGVHRSVVIAQWVGHFLREKGYRVKVLHRELGE